MMDPRMGIVRSGECGCRSCSNKDLLQQKNGDHSSGCGGDAESNSLGKCLCDDSDCSCDPRVPGAAEPIASSGSG